MKRWIPLALVLCAAWAAPAQESSKTMLQAGRKLERAAVGKSAEKRRVALEQAARVYRQVPERWPASGRDVATAWLRVADVERRLGNSDAALAALEKVLGVEGERAAHARALAQKARLLRRSKDLDGARAAIAALLERHGEEDKLCAEARLDLARMARQEKRWREALDRAQEVLDRHPARWRENVDACDLIVGIYVRCRRWQEAAAKLTELDRLLEDRFGDHERAESVRRAMAKMSSRAMLTPVAID